MHLQNHAKFAKQRKITNQNLIFAKLVITKLVENKMLHIVNFANLKIAKKIQTMIWNTAKPIKDCKPNFGKILFARPAKHDLLDIVKLWDTE